MPPKKKGHARHWLDLVLLAGPGYLPSRVSVEFPHFDSTSGESVVTVGRYPPSCDCYLDERMVFCSKRHASIIARADDKRGKRPSSFVIRDLGSINGTFVNSTKVNETILHDGDVVIFGGSHLTPLGMQLTEELMAKEEVVQWRVDFHPQAFVERAAEEGVHNDDAARKTLVMLRASRENDEEEEQDVGLLAAAGVNLDLGMDARKSIRQRSSGRRVATALDLSDSASPKRKRVEGVDSQGATPAGVAHQQQRANAAFNSAKLTSPFEGGSSDTKRPKAAPPIGRPSLDEPLGRKLGLTPSPAPARLHDPLEPPPPIAFEAVRVGDFSVVAQRAKSLAPLDTLAARLHMSQGGPVGDRLTTHGLTFTETHWKWKMQDPNQNTRNITQMLLPHTIIDRIGMAFDDSSIVVFIKAGCNVPMVSPLLIKERRVVSFLVRDVKSVAVSLSEYFQRRHRIPTVELSAADSAGLTPS